MKTTTKKAVFFLFILTLSLQVQAKTLKNTAQAPQTPPVIEPVEGEIKPPAPPKRNPDPPNRNPDPPNRNPVPPTKSAEEDSRNPVPPNRVPPPPSKK